jgi:hypothetical protein
MAEIIQESSYFLMRNLHKARINFDWHRTHQTQKTLDTNLFTLAVEGVAI